MLSSVIIVYVSMCVSVLIVHLIIALNISEIFKAMLKYKYMSSYEYPKVDLIVLNVLNFQCTKLDF